MVDKSKLTVDELREYRRTLIRDAASFKKTDRTPHLSFYISWPVLDSGYTFHEGLYDWDIMEKCMIEHEEKYQFDAIQCLGTRNPMKITEALGVQKYIINEAGDFMNILDEVYVNGDELQDLIDDPNKVLWTKVMPRKYPMFKPGIGVEPFANAFKEQQEYMNYTMRINKRMQQEMGVPAHSSPACGFFTTGYETMFTMLGIKQLSLSMRRNPDLVKQASDKLDEAGFAMTINNIKNSPFGPDPNTALDCLVNTLVNTIMNNKQFERYLWEPRLKVYLDTMQAQGKQSRIYMHGSLKRFYDYYNDYNKGSLVFMSEDESVYELRENMPNFAVCGGLNTVMMGHNTPEECVDYTKKLIDDLGTEGGLILCINTMGMYRQDTKAENLKAISDFIQTYQPE